MSFTNPQPGDTDPRDEGARAGDRARAYADGGPNDFAGDTAARDGAKPGDKTKEKRKPLADSVNTIHFSAPFIKRPVATFLLSFAVILAGIGAYSLLPVASLPDVEFPVISVSASLPGADPETVASALTTPLERQFSRIAGVNEMTSSSSSGSSSITLQFDLSRDINGAARDVQAAINAARSQLPADLPSNPSYRKINPSDAPILIMALTSDTASVAQMYDISDSILAQKMAQVDGVGQTFTTGSAKPAVRIEVNPNQLVATGLGLEAVRSAIGTINVLQPTGYLNGFGADGQRVAITSTDQLFKADDYRNLIIATDRGPVTNATAATGLPASSASAVATGSSSAATTAVTNFATSRITTTGAANAHGIVRLGDIAHVFDGVENTQTAGYFNSKPAILLIVFKSQNANVIATADRVLALLPSLQASIPPAMKLQVVLDRTGSIRASVADARRNLLISILLVVLVVFAFLRETRSTLIPAVSVPLSLLGTFGVMYLLGYTLDNLSLMALTISTGFVVDDAIVVIENISRHLEEGLSPFDAAMLGSKEIGFTVLSMSISLIAVFIPILLMGGIVGSLFREFAVTLSVAIAVSLVVSLTTTPMLSAKFLKPHDQVKKGWFYRMGERHLDNLTAFYARSLRWVLRHKGLIAGVFVATFALNIYLFIIIPKGFFPSQDTGRLSGTLKGQQDSSFDNMNAKLKQVIAITDKDRSVVNSLGFLGSGPGGGSTASASMFITLADIAQRQKNGDTPDAVIARLRPKTANMPGAQLLLQSYQELRVGGRSSATQYQYTLTGDSVDALNTWAPKMMAAMAKLPELKDVSTDQESNGLREQLIIDRDTASRLGVTVLNIDSVLNDAFGQRQVSTTYLPLNQYHVIMAAQDKYQNEVTDISNIYIKSTSGAMIPLSAVSHYETERVPLSVQHQGLSPATTLSFNLTPGVAISQAETAIAQSRVSIGMPSNIVGGFAGTAQAASDAFSQEPLLILVAILSVYIVLGVLYESLIHPLTILSTLPSAGVGALLALLMFKIELSLIAAIGILLLIGIVKKNAILMIDFALVAEREHGRTPEEAIYEACLMRFRPIMMTTMAALLGGVPLALGRGSGGELRQPLGVTIVGGLIVSQALTLFTTPVIYLIFDWIRLHLPAGRRRLLEALGLGRFAGPANPSPAHAAGD